MAGDDGDFDNVDDDDSDDGVDDNDDGVDDLKGKRSHLSPGSTSVNYIQQPESQ